MEGGDLVHELLVDGQTSGGIDDDYGIAVGLCLGYGVPGNPDGILLTFFGIYLDSDLLSQDFQLFDCRRTEGVAGREQDLHPSFALDVGSQLGRERGLSGSVQTGDEDYPGIPLDIDVL